MAFVTMLENATRQGRPVVAAMGVQGLGLAVAKSRGSRFDAQRKCPHLGFGVCRGRLERGTLTCELHHA
ncbi:Rieske 2Fe-2S domain-containing protein [Novosphingobium sp. PP1Y]|uniref:Rieske 2Fe-2S domain-containing protein n=1 Tax=Novosphingobium sp. PP1Y TaxID=702113 RepID=UPI0002D9A775|nr:Rieske 2Fe-2S domain-containing protein [Novosphingobium sp. PP1Y]